MAAIAADRTLLERVGACASGEGVENALGWAYEHAYKFAAAPGWTEAYGEAIEAGVDDPGDEITDAMVLDAVRQVVQETGGEPE